LRLERLLWIHLNAEGGLDLFEAKRVGDEFFSLERPS
jgi:hypothetical protein